MALFLSTFINKVDRKGRVSVPAPFRAALIGQSFHGIVAFPSFRDTYDAVAAHKPLDKIESLWQPALDEFKTRRARHLLYP